MAACTQLVVALVALLVAVVVGAEEKYTNKFDNVNIDDILKNDRLLNSYFQCIMDKGKCTPDGEELKKHIPEALETNCEKCSVKQKEETEKVLKFIQEKKPGMFKEMEDKYDPNGNYRQKYENLAEQKKIKL